MADGQQLGFFGELIAGGVERKEQRKQNEYVNSFLEYLSGRARDTSYTEGDMVQDVIKVNLQNDPRVQQYVQLYSTQRSQKKQAEQQQQQIQGAVETISTLPKDEFGTLADFTTKGIQSGALSTKQGIDIFLDILKAKKEDEQKTLAEMTKIFSKSMAESQLPVFQKEGKEIPVSRKGIADFLSGAGGAEFGFREKPVSETRVVNISKKEGGGFGRNNRVTVAQLNSALARYSRELDNAIKNRARIEYNNPDDKMGIGFYSDQIEQLNNLIKQTQADLDQARRQEGFSSTLRRDQGDVGASENRIINQGAGGAQDTTTVQPQRTTTVQTQRKYRVIKQGAE